MRRAVLAMFLCAAPLIAASAQASTGLVERQALREALRQQVRAAGGHVVPLPLPEPVRASAAGAASAGDELERIAAASGPQRLLVGARAHADVPGVAAELRRLGAEPELLEPIAAFVATVPSGAEAVAALGGDPRVAYLERDRTLRVAADQYDVVDPDAQPFPTKFTWAYDAVRAGEALAAVGGGSARTVAVIDTGLDVNHVEFQGQIARVVDTRSGRAEVTDSVGHGTFVSGLIAARDNNGFGGKGVAGATKLMAIRASRNGEFRLVELIRGIVFAIRRGGDVLNMSFAGEGFTRTHARALEAAFLNDALPVAASGNNGEQGNPLEFPAAAIGGRRGRPGIGLSVAATRPNGEVASFSTHNDSVSLAAPGASGGSCEFGVFSTLPPTTQPAWDEGGCPRVFSDPSGYRYAYGEGTSFAAPIVSGLAALAWQAEPRLASEQVAEVMMRSAGNGGWNEFTGRGVVDGADAVALARVYDVVDPRPRATARRRGDRVRVRVARSRDRTDPGDELAGGVTHGLLVSRDGGRTYRVVTSRRRGGFTRTVGLRGHRQNVLISTACDRNGNCGVKRLGRFRAR